MQQYMTRVSHLLAEIFTELGIDTDTLDSSVRTGGPADLSSLLWSWLELPPDKTMGDIALPCFRLAKTLRQAPVAIATSIADAVTAHIAAAGANDAEQVASAAAPPNDWTLLTDATTAGPYVNLRLRRSSVTRDVLHAIAMDNGYCHSGRGAGKIAAIDLSSPNIAKPFGIGHLRSTVIGTAIANLMESDGYQTLRINHLGDWGTQFGKIITSYRLYGDPDKVRANPIPELNDLYVFFHQQEKLHPELEDEGRAAFLRLEEGDPDSLALWQWMIEVSMVEFQRTYDLLSSRFDFNLGESFYNDKMQAVIDELREKGLLEVSEGAEVVRLDEENLPPCLIRKSDGATLYPTRDLAAALYRHHALHADELIYVVGGEQRLHFAQLFAVLARMGYDFAAHCSHVAFGMMLLEGKKMSTRKGQVVRLQEVLEEAIARAKAIISEKNPLLPDADAVARAVGVGAVVFNDLKNNRLHDIDFSLDKALAFDGETGPYVQYTHARTCSVLRKAGLLADGDASPGEALTSADSLSEIQTLEEPEWELTKLLSQYPQVRLRAIDERDPSLIAKLAMDICQEYNHFYHDCPILTSTAAIRERRLALTDATRLLIRHALSLLGLEAPASM
ncbi:MAG: arginine--tRNA ligase [Firmicutes bacterium]|nr:arginine--tRNA ligase [Bacillota bacterium]